MSKNSQPDDNDAYLKLASTLVAASEQATHDLNAVFAEHLPSKTYIDDAKKTFRVLCHFIGAGLVLNMRVFYNHLEAKDAQELSDKCDAILERYICAKYVPDTNDPEARIRAEANLSGFYGLVASTHSSSYFLKDMKEAPQIFSEIVAEEFDTTHVIVLFALQEQFMKLSAIYLDIASRFLADAKIKL